MDRRMGQTAGRRAWNHARLIVSQQVEQRQRQRSRLAANERCEDLAGRSGRWVEVRGGGINFRPRNIAAPMQRDTAIPAYSSKNQTHDYSKVAAAPAITMLLTTQPEAKGEGRGHTTGRK